MSCYFSWPVGFCVSYGKFHHWIILLKRRQLILRFSGIGEYQTLVQKCRRRGLVRRCTLRTGCKSWNSWPGSFIIAHQFSRLNNGFFYDNRKQPHSFTPGFKISLKFKRFFKFIWFDVRQTRFYSVFERDQGTLWNVWHSRMDDPQRLLNSNLVVQWIISEALPQFI